MIRIFLLITLLVAGQKFQAQVPAPAPEQTGPIAVTGATIHVGNGTIITNGTVVFDKGLIVAVGNNVTVPAGAQVIDGTGKHVYPGFIAPATYMGLSEIDALRHTRDMDEVGDYNPNVRSIIAYSTDSRVTPVTRSNGILTAEIAPQGGRISGSSSVVQLDAWNWEDAALKTDMGIHINWPAMYRQTGWWGEPGPIEFNKKYPEQVNELINYLKEAKAYAQLSAPQATNLKFEAMKGLFDGSKKLFVHVDGAREIMSVADFKKQMGLDVVIVGGEEAFLVTEVLVENDIPVVLRNLHVLPPRPEDDVDLPFKLPFLLQQAGVKFCLSIYGGWEQRNLMFMAGTASNYGLSREEALASITSSTADILGIGEIVGTLEAGKHATLIVSTGDALDMRTNNIEYAFIQGRQIDLDNKQKMLYRKFKTKYDSQP